MSTLSEYKDLLITGAEMEQCGEKQCAEWIYKAYVKELAKTDDGLDVLEFLYGRYIYQAQIDSYGEAVAWGAVASCARKLVEYMRSSFPDSYCWSSYESKKELVAFFTWLGTPRADIDWEKDYAVLRGAYQALKGKESVQMQVSGAVQSQTLMSVVNGLVNAQYSVYRERIQA